MNRKIFFKANTIPYLPFAESETFVIEAVDLGLPSGLKWANANVGATSVSDGGLYFAWGETTGYTADSGHTFNYTTYTASDIISDLDLGHDAAHVNLGGAWRMPTKAEFEELANNTTQTWTDDYNGTGVPGMIVKSKTNDNQIFMPAAGYFDGGSELDGYGLMSSFWSSTTKNEEQAYRLFAAPDYFVIDAACFHPDGGFTIRAVQE